MLNFTALLTSQRGFPMTRYTQIVIAVTLVCCLAGCGDSSAPTKEGGKAASTAVDATFFSGATVIPGDGSPVIEDAAILVENGKFKAIGKRGEVKPVQGAGRADLSGHFIMPVLVNL